MAIHMAYFVVICLYILRKGAGIANSVPRESSNFLEEKFHFYFTRVPELVIL
jgi:hypothetical protein